MSFFFFCSHIRCVLAHEFHHALLLLTLSSQRLSMGCILRSGSRFGFRLGFCCDCRLLGSICSPCCTLLQFCSSNYFFQSSLHVLRLTLNFCVFLLVFIELLLEPVHLLL